MRFPGSSMGWGNVNHMLVEAHASRPITLPNREVATSTLGFHGTFGRLSVRRARLVFPTRNVRQMSDAIRSVSSVTEKALRCYINGERLCDAGRPHDGIKSFQRAFDLMPELEGEEWPTWAAEMHTVLMNAVESDEPPILENTDELQPELAALRQKQQSEAVAWWQSDGAIGAVAAALVAQHFVVLDGFLGGDLAARVRGACTRAWSRDEYRPSRPAVADALRGAPPAARSDMITWDPEGVAELSGQVDALVAALRGHLPTHLSHVASRQRPMCSRYGHGDAFARHVDNHCHHGEGDACNGRVLTSVYYMQDAGWDAATDGGCLRFFHSQQAAPGTPPLEADETAPRCDVAPLSDRLVLFFSDFRAPHEVLPVRRPDAERFAATIWYWSGLRVPEWWVDGVHDCELVPLRPAAGVAPSPVSVRRAHLVDESVEQAVL